MEVDTLHIDGTRMAATSVYNGPSTTGLRVMVPDSPAAGQPHRFLYVLPVKPDDNTDFGDGFDEVVDDDLHNDYNMTIIAPEFHIEPWMADNPSDTDERYDSFVAIDLREWVIANLTQTGVEPHWLMSFSKGGLSVLTLIFRHPARFQQAAAWDVPADNDDVAAQAAFEGGYANMPYGTEANFLANYSIENLLATWAVPVPIRIWLSGDTSVYHASTLALHNAMVTLGVLHTWPTPFTSRSHAWTTGWVPLAVAGLVANADANPPRYHPFRRG